jgi:OMF family outer membrane factor
MIMKSTIDLLKQLVSIHYLGVVIMIPVFLTAVSGNLNAQTVSLEEAVASALQYNRTLKLARADIDLAGEKRKEAAGNLLPKLNASADYRYFTELPYQLMPASVFGGPPGTYREVQFGVPQNLSANLQLSVPLFNPVAINTLKTLDIAGEIAGLQYELTEEEVVLNVTQTYYNAQILLSQLSFLDTNIINTEKLEKSVLLLYEQELAKRTDIERVRLQLNQLIAKKSFTRAQYKQVTSALEFLMGKPATDSLEVDPALFSVEEKVIDSEQTIELKLLEMKLQLNNSELKSLRLSRMPSMGAYAVYGTTGFGNTGSNSFFDFYPVSFAGVQLSFPLFNGTVTNHRIKQKKIETSKTRIQQELASDRNNMEKINATRQFEAAEEQFNTTISQVELAEKIYLNTVLQNKQGVASLSDVLMSDTALREAQQNYTSSLISLFRADLELKRVTGNLLK